MKFRIFLCVGIIGLFLSCQELLREEKKEVSNSIERDQIDTFFGNHISKILFDHLYVVVDSVTYAKITKNDHWKNTYGNLDIGLPNFEPLDNITTSTTCYLRGHEHYIEILGPSNTYNEPVGKSGIGFSLRNRKEHFHLGVKPKLIEENAAYLQASEIVDMPINNEEKTWFKAFYTPSPGTALHTWYAFYNPSFLDKPHLEPNRIYSRETFLQKTYSDKRLFNGIKRITMQCTEKDFERIAQELRYLGCKLLERDGKSLIIESGDVELKITASDSVSFSRITKIHCRLNIPDKSTTQLGNLVIVNNGTESIWNFNALYKNR